MSGSHEGAQVFEISLARPNSSVSWGFRLQGGADFSTPLSIQLVQPSSVAEASGLQAGDGILKINGSATETLEHDRAKAEIIRAGNEIVFLVQRSAVTTWRPTVTPMSELKPAELQTHALPGEAPPMQKTSLAANQQPVQHIGSSHNRSARPFGTSQVQGRSTISPESHISIRDSFPDAAGHPDSYGRNQLQEEYLKECGGVVPDVNYDVQPSQRQQGHAGPLAASSKSPSAQVVQAQYNNPRGIYSNRNAGDSLQQQVEGVKDDFESMRVHDEQLASPTRIAYNNNDIMKSPVSSTQAEPIKTAVQLALEQEEQTDASLYKGGNVQSKSFKLLEQELVAENGADKALPPGVRSVQAPKTNMKMTGPRYKQPTTKCYVCGNFISGVFVRVKEHCLHAECLKCAQCNRNLKNIGYIWVQDKLYCVQHARELTRPPGGGYTAYVIDAPDNV